jgi:hypothetical protein
MFLKGTCNMWQSAKVTNICQSMMWLKCVFYTIFFWCNIIKITSSNVMSNVYIYILVWTPCLMHRCVCIWWYILQNYNYKLHFQNLSIYHIPHVFIGTLAAENLDVCIACDPWDSNIQLTMVKDQRWQIYPKCHSNRKLTTILMYQNLGGAPPRGWACLS